MQYDILDQKKNQTHFHVLFQSEIWFWGSLNRAAQPFFSRYVSKDSRGGDIYNGVYYVSKEALATIVNI